MADEKHEQPQSRKKRLSESGFSADLLPWRKAEGMKKCFLYWAPISVFPAQAADRAWLLEFTTQLGQRLKTNFKVEPHVFLQHKTEVTVHDEFVRRAQEFMPLMGLGRRPGADTPEMPTDQELQNAIDRKRKLNVNDYTADYTYWLMTKADARQREVFQGLGGLTILYRVPDPKAKPPEIKIPPRYQDHPLFKRFDVPGMVAGACSMQDEFMTKSKTAFGAGLKPTAHNEFIPFILPLLQSADFFQMSEEDMKAHFDLFDVYMQESPADQGVLLASKHDLEPLLIEVNAAMKALEAEKESGSKREKESVKA